MAKRKPDKQLTHDNWDEEEDPEEAGSFQRASNDVLRGRVIKQARRRNTNSSVSDSEPKSVFAGFTGFGNQSENKKFSFNSIVPATTAESICNHADSKKFSLNSNVISAPLTVTNKQPFKFSFASNPVATISNSIPEGTPTNTVAGKTPTASKITDLPFSASLLSKSSGETDKTSKLNELSSELQKTGQPVKSDNSNPSSPDEIFLLKLRSLNLLCAEWIIKHLNENLSYILTPIFDDYQKYLNKLKEERQRNSSTAKKVKLEPPSTSTARVELVREPPQSVKTSSTSTFKPPDFKSGLSKFNSFSSLPTESPSTFTFASPPADGKTFNLKFSKSSKNDSVDSDFENASQLGKGDGPLFKFTAVSKPVETTIAEPKPTHTFGAATTNGGFFSGLSKCAPPSGEQISSASEDEPPPVVNESITEEGSIYEKKCKVFIKKEGTYVDHGVGFLFLKLIGDEKKCQLIVRANNTLATIMLNVLLGANVPVQLMGTNNVMLICCPTPDAKPSSVLLKVKTAQDAEELLKTLNEHKK